MSRLIDIENPTSYRWFTISAFCRAGLIFDGSLVIDPECRTNDRFIFAAGTVTRYSRKFYVDAWQHKHYNSTETGERVSIIERRNDWCRQLLSNL